MTHAYRVIVASIVVSTLVACGKGNDQRRSAGDEYIAKSKAIEATEFVKKMALGAKAYYYDEHVSGTMEVAPAQFPRPSAGPTPPLGSCCKQEGGKCSPDPSLWADAPWPGLMFSLDDPYYFSYAYRLADDGRSITASAHGDLDCDGDYSTFAITVSATGDGEVEVGAVVKKNELE